MISSFVPILHEIILQVYSEVVSGGCGHAIEESSIAK